MDKRESDKQGSTVVKNSTTQLTQNVAYGDSNRVSKEYGTRTNVIIDVIIPFIATQDQDR